MSTAIQPIIEIHNLNVTYAIGRHQEVQALKNISLSIYPGEFIIFFGPSGCGKSTLLYSISGLETHARGDIRVAGHQVTSLTPAEVATFRQKQIGMIFQAFYLIPSLTVVKNVLVPQMAIGAAPEVRMKRAKELLEHFGVASQANKLPTDLSGGQQQRVAICRALMNDPDILLADEPVGNLDSKSANDVISLIQEQNSTQGKTVILVTHDASHLHLAHRVFYIKDGQLISTKVNRSIFGSNEQPPAQPSTTKELELLAQSFHSLHQPLTHSLLLAVKAKEIVTEVMTGRSTDELESIEAIVRAELEKKITDPRSMSRFLDVDERAAGLGYDHRTAVQLAEKIEAVVREIAVLQEHTLHSDSSDRVMMGEAVEIRRHILEWCGVHLRHEHERDRLDWIIHQRLARRIDAEAVFRAFRDTAPGGLGWTRSVARRAQQRIELLLLGTVRL
jgi:putative ABC transport system ATP-binding protein